MINRNAFGRVIKAGLFVPSAIMLLVAIPGCSVSVPVTDRDVKASGAVDSRATLLNSGVAGKGANIEMQTVSLPQSGTVIVIAGEEPIWSQSVQAGDKVNVEVTNGWVGDYHVLISATDRSKFEIDSKCAGYRIFFEPAS